MPATWSSSRLTHILLMIIMLMLGVGAARQADAAEQAPFHATFTTVSVGTLCGPLTVCVTAEGTGQATHLGRTQITKNVILHITFVPCNGGTLRQYTLDQTLTAANGDTLTMSGSGESCAGPDGSLVASGAFTVTGGTGRFSGASGAITESVVRVGTGPETVTLTGMISSPNSAK